MHLQADCNQLKRFLKTHILALIITHFDSAVTYLVYSILEFILTQHLCFQFVTFRNRRLPNMSSDDDDEDDDELNCYPIMPQTRVT